MIDYKIRNEYLRHDGTFGPVVLNANDQVIFEGGKRECWGYVREAKGLGPMPESSR